MLVWTPSRPNSTACVTPGTGSNGQRDIRRTRVSHPGTDCSYHLRARPRLPAEPPQDGPGADPEVTGEPAQAPRVRRLPAFASVCHDGPRRCKDARHGLAVDRDVTGATARLPAQPEGSELGAGPLHPAPAAGARGGVFGELGHCFSRIATTLAESRNARMASLAHQCAGDIGGCASRRRRASIASRIRWRMADFMDLLCSNLGTVATGIEKDL